MFFFTVFCIAQNESNIWYFGEYAGLDFNSGSPTVLLDGVLNTDEGCATISDSAGNLLFYTDGTTVYNRNHSVMQNGDNLNGNYTSTHSAIIVPKPNSNTIYYIFTVDAEAGPNGLQYSEVDITLDSGLGGITTNKNIPLFTPTTEKLTAIRSFDETEYWVVSHKWESDEFIAYKVTSNGVELTPVVSAAGSYVGGTQNTATIGQIKISPDGTKLAVARERGYSEAQLFDFDSSTGIVSNAITLLDFPDNELIYGVEFSPNSKVLYVSHAGVGVYQYNLIGSASDIINSRLQIIDVPRPYQSMQLATDGKIYVAKAARLYIDVIDNPNVVGLGCNYQYEHLYLEGRKSFRGLPPFIQTYFNIEDFEVDNVCFGDTTQLTLTDPVDSVTWNFGDPASGVNNTSTDVNPTHIFTAPGTYTVTADVSVGNQLASSSATVVIYEQPTASQPDNIEVCDSDNDGFVAFNLTLQDTETLNGQDTTVFEVIYYASNDDYVNNNPITSPSNYINEQAFTPQTIVAEVVNSVNNDCAAVTDFTIQVFDQPNPAQNIPKLSDCDNTSYGTDSDNQIEFDLTQNESTILNGQLVSNFTITYYTDQSLLNPIANPSNYVNGNPQETIYVEMTNNLNTNCSAITSFQVEVFPLPEVSPGVDLRQCDDDLDGFSAFNLNEAQAEISSNYANETITFHESLSDAQTNSNTINNNSSYTNQTVSSDTVWARVENNFGCYRTTQINLLVSTTQIPANFHRNFYECDDGADPDDGIATFDFGSVDNEIQALFPPGQQLNITYYENLPDALQEVNAISDITNYQNTNAPGQQDIYVRVDSEVDNDCLGLGHHITLHVESVPIAHTLTFEDQCDADGDGMFPFDTSNLETDILNGQIDVNVFYFDESGLELPNPLPNPFLTGTQTITVRVENANSQDSDGACYDETTIDFVVEAAAIAFPIQDYAVCDMGNDGIGEFDTSTLEAEVLNGQLNMVVSYFDANGNALPSPLTNPFITESQTITARVENPLNDLCYDETSVNFVVVAQPYLEMTDTWSICENGTVTLVADDGYDAYLWSTGETTQSIVVEAPGTYEVMVANIYSDLRCEDMKTITVLQSEAPTITSIDVDDWTLDNNIITVNVTGNGNYEYSLDGIEYQDSNEFTDVQVNTYVIHVRDKNGCGEATEEVFLMGYPKFFTPNNDGYNDTWQVYNAQREPENKIFIFDRYGKLIKQLSPLAQGWDGTFNGKTMPNDSYWFVIERANGLTYKGHFALKR